VSVCDGWPGDDALFASLSKEVPRLGVFNAQNLANTVWAFATVGQSNAELFTTLA